MNAPSLPKLLSAFGVSLLVGLSGCTAEEGGEPAGTDGTDGSPEPGGDNGTGNATPGALTVTILNYTQESNGSDPIEVEWQIEAESGDETPPVIDMTAVFYGNESVMSPPNSTEDYGNSSGEQTNVPPGTFNTSFAVEESGTVYVRAYARYQGLDYWSDEVMVESTGAGGELGAKVMMRSAALGYLSGYDPDPVTIQVGQAIVWANADNEDHTATGDDFDTGDIAGEAESEPIVFTEPGTYTYGCSNHFTMTGEIVVES